MSALSPDITPCRTGWLTPPQIARARGIRIGKVMTWIRSGELEAVNLAERRTGKPRWRISAAALDAFDRARSNRVAVTPAPVRRCRPERAEVIEFF